MRSVSSPGEKAQWTCLKWRSGEKRTRLQSPGTKPRPRPCLSQIATCSSLNGNPVPNITWYRNGQQLKVPTELNSSEPSGAKGDGGWGGGWWQGLVTSSCCLSLTEGYMTSRTVREASGLYSLTSTLYLRLYKEDRDARFHCAAQYKLPSGQVGHLDSPAFQLTLHCESP